MNRRQLIQAALAAPIVAHDPRRVYSFLWSNPLAPDVALGETSLEMFPGYAHSNLRLRFESRSIIQHGFFVLPTGRDIEVNAGEVMVFRGNKCIEWHKAVPL